jgi:hypothetical protein
MRFKKITLMVFIIYTLCLSIKSASTQTGSIIQKETVYVPAYSSIFHGKLKWEFNLSITLSIHNIDMKNKIIIDSIDYYNTSGKLIHRYTDNKKIILNPLETYNLGIKETDDRGGIGANFIIKWYAHSKVKKPIIETIMIGTRGQQGISFTSRGVTIDE